MHLMRARFKQDIVAEFLPPYLGKNKKKSNRVIIFCDGLPNMPSKKRLLEFWSSKGYWVFHPRYRGTWESAGEFLVSEPDRDILDVVSDLKEKKKVLSQWDKKEYEIDAQEIFIFGASFGGATALMASRDPRIKKVVCVSPLTDWLAPSDEEPLEKFDKMIKGAFGEAYRFRQENWERLKTGNFFNPSRHIPEFDGKKIMIVHASDDTIVRDKEVIDFAKKIACDFTLLKTGGHMSANLTSKFWWYWKIKKFLR